MKNMTEKQPRELQPLLQGNDTMDRPSFSCLQYNSLPILKAMMAKANSLITAEFHILTEISLKTTVQERDQQPNTLTR